MKPSGLHIVFILLALLAVFTATAQTTVSGVVKDSLNNPVSFGNVFAKKSDTGSSNFSATTDAQGKYIITLPEQGNYTIQFSALFFGTKEIQINVQQNTVYTQNIVLHEQATQLDEVIIQSERAVVIKKDTIVFDAAAFSQGNEQVVEDLLKKIPGLTVSPDGVIKVGGQEVEKVMIDGDDFFEKGYKLLTKNMPVNPVNKVELLQHYSNNKLLKGVEESDKVALNLTLKDDYKRQWFGNVNAGYGVVSENRYELKGNLMNFGKDTKYYFLTNLNNTGIDATGDINHLIRSYSVDEPGNIGDDVSAGALLSLNTYLPALKQKRINFNNAEMFSVNAIHNFNAKLKLKTLGFFNSDENSFFKNSFESFFAGGTGFANSEDLKIRNNTITGFGKAELNYDISKTKAVKYTGKFNLTDTKGKSDLLFNDDYLNERLTSDNRFTDHHLVYTNKLKDNKAFILSGRYINEKTPQHYSANQFIYQELFNADANNIKQYSQNKMQFAGVQAQLINRQKNGNLFQAEAGSQIRYDNMESALFLYNGNSAVLEPDAYQNDVDYIVSDTYLNGSYRYNFKKFGVFTELQFHQYYNQLKLFEDKRNQSPFFVNPKAGIDWTINKSNKLRLSYSFNSANAGIMDVYGGYVHTDFRMFSSGTGSFNRLDASSTSLNYNFGSWSNNFFGNVFLAYTQNHDFFSTNSIVEQNYSRIEKILIKNREFFLLSSEINRYIKSLSSTLKGTLGGSRYNYSNVVNNSDFRNITSALIYGGVELRSGFSGFFNFHTGSRWDYTEVKTGIKNSYVNNTSFLDLSFVFSDKLDVEIQSERYYFGNMDSHSNKYYFLDMDARYTIFKNKFTVSVSGQNLFNTKEFINYSINDISTSIQEYRLMPRYVLLKVEYRF